MFDRWQDVGEEVQLGVLLEQVQIFLEFFKSDFVSFLVFGVLAGLLLNSVIGEVDVLVGAVFEAELEAGGADVPSWVEVPRDVGVRDDKHEAPDIEFPLVEEIGMDVLLDYERSLAMSLHLSFYVSLHLLSFLTDLDPTSTV